MSSSLDCIRLQHSFENNIAALPWQCRSNTDIDASDLDAASKADGSSLYGTERWQRSLRRQLLGTEIRCGQKVLLYIGSRQICFTVVGAEKGAHSMEESSGPSQGIVGDQTRFNIEPASQFPQPKQLLPGYEAEVAGLVAEISGYFKHKDRFQHLNIKPVQSIYVSGITGIGKTTVIRRSLGRLQYPVVYGNLRDIVVNASGTDFAEEYISMALNDLADRAQAAAPSVIVLDRVDILNDKELMEETEGVYGKFSSFVESIADGVFLVLESSVDAADMHVATRKTSALQHSQVIPIPNLQRRCEIVLWAIEKYMGATKDSHVSDLSKSVSIDQLAKQVANATAGYVARDIMKLCRQSFLRMLRENPRLPHDRECDLAEELKNMSLGPTAGKKLMLGWEHFSESLQLVRPSQHLEFEGVRPTKRWKDIGGYESTKQALQRFMKLATGESRSALGIKAPSGILLYGPTGCGKTAMALAMIGESACNVIYIRG
ncbi:hypothetical protein H4R99_006543 [Coemansia sp. RSA 1722]|nr:hypothetical protein IWW45_007016 [Coemansia sp. RSA 485]KAJ2592035.1 hypothetical protein H4R99_006543 [Coemansia sp. RSA 1722]